MSFGRMQHIMRFLISGTTAVGLMLGLLYVCTEFLGIWYLASAAISFVIAVATGFLLQKYWAFKDHRTEVFSRQVRRYVAILLWDLFLNTGLLYVLVDRIHLWYLGAQVIVSALIAAQNFYLYRTFLFSDPETSHSSL